MKLHLLIFINFFEFLLSLSLRSRLKNPTQSQNGGAEQQYERSQQATEHFFLAFPHRMENFEKQNPYVRHNVKEELQERIKEYKDLNSEKNLFQDSLDSQMKKTVEKWSVHNGITSFQNPSSASNEFSFKLNPHINIPHSSNVSQILNHAKNVISANEEKRQGKLFDYVQREINQTEKAIREKGHFTLKDLVEPFSTGFNMSFSHLNLSENVIGRDAMTLDLSDHSEETRVKTIDELVNEKLKKKYSIHSLNPDGVGYLVDKSNKTYYNGWIRPHELPYYDNLYISGYYKDFNFT